MSVDLNCHFSEDTQGPPDRVVAYVLTYLHVDEGQTVAASLSAPTLFTIAQDLSQVQVDAQIDEADIGQIREGQWT